MAHQDFDLSCALMRELGFEIKEARSTPEVFGSWWIRAVAKGKSLRVVWDGRDATLFIQRPSLSGSPSEWSDRWIAGERYAHKPRELREGLLSVLLADG